MALLTIGVIQKLLLHSIKMGIDNFSEHKVLLLIHPPTFKSS